MKNHLFLRKALLLLDESDVLIELLGLLRDAENGTCLQVRIENNSEEYLVNLCGTLTVNGEDVTYGWADEYFMPQVKAGEQGEYLIPLTSERKFLLVRSLSLSFSIHSMRSVGEDAWIYGGTYLTSDPVDVPV